MTGHLKDSQEDGMKELRDSIRNKTKADYQEVVEKLKACTDSLRIQEKIDKAAAYTESFNCLSVKISAFEPASRMRSTKGFVLDIGLKSG